MDSEGGSKDYGGGGLLCGRSGIGGVLVGLVVAVGGLVRGDYDWDLSVAAFHWGGRVVVVVLVLVLVPALVGLVVVGESARESCD